MPALRTTTLIVAALVVCFATIARAEDENKSDNEKDSMAALVQELHSLNENLTKLLDRLGALEERVAGLEQKAAVPEPPQPPWMNMPGMRAADTEALGKIKLPENATDEQVIEYINQIAVASEGQNMFSGSDPQARMLAAVGHDHLDQLFAAINTRGLRYYTKDAIAMLVTEDDRQMVVDKLTQQPDLVEVVVDRGWVDAARNVLIDEMTRRRPDLPGEWIEAVAQMHDASTYDSLKWYFVNGDNQAYTFQCIQYLPGIELNDAVAEAWKRARFNDQWEREEMARIAVNYGILEALECLIDGLRLDADGDPRGFNTDETRPAILRCIKFRGTDEQIIKWFDDNYDRLRFAPESGKYVVEPGVSLAPPAHAFDRTLT